MEIDPRLFHTFPLDIPLLDMEMPAAVLAGRVEGKERVPRAALKAASVVAVSELAVDPSERAIVF